MPARAVNNMYMPIQKLGDLEPVTFKLSIFFSSNSLLSDLFLIIQPMKSNNDTITDQKSHRNVFVISHASKVPGVIAIPKLRYNFSLYANVSSLISIDNTILTTKKIIDRTIINPIIAVQIVKLILAVESFMLIPMYNIESST